MSWYNEAIFYHIYPLGLTGAPKHNDYRSFLRKSGMNDFVSLVETNFGESRFFAVSALGRPANENSSMGFKGVLSLESFEWIASKADPKFMKSFFDTYRGRR